MSEPIDPNLMNEEAERMGKVLRRLGDLRRVAIGEQLSPEEQAMKALIEAASQPLNQE